MRGVDLVEQMVQVSVLELPKEQRDFLLDLAKKGGKMDAPVYYRHVTGEVFFVADYVLKDIKAFEKTALEGLYRGGGLIKLLTRYGQVVLYDERHKWLRLIGGVAKFNEGSDLRRTAVREAVIEELAVLTDGEKSRLVPFGLENLMAEELAIPEWGIVAETVKGAGSLSVVGSCFNDANRAFEIVVEWDISACDGLTILHREDWFRGGLSGFIPFVINECADIVGVFDGRHGYVPLPVVGVHPTLQMCL